MLTKGFAVWLTSYVLLQVAKTMAPSVIYIDEVEKVFVSDKKKAKEFGGQVGWLRLWSCHKGFAFGIATQYCSPPPGPSTPYK